MSQGQVFYTRVKLRRFDDRRRMPAAPAAQPCTRPGRCGVARRRAVVSVLTGLALFFAVQVGTGLAIDTEVSPLRDPVYFDKFDILRRRPAFFAAPAPERPTTLLCIGSSRTLNAVDAGAMAPHLSAAVGRPVEVFNFGQAGAGPLTNAIYARRLRQAGANPDFVLIEVHPTFLAGQRPDPPEARWLLPFRLRPDELSVARGTGFPADTPATHGHRQYLASLYEYRFLVLDRYAPFMLMNNCRLNGGHESDERGFTRLQDEVPPAKKAQFLRIAHGQYANYFAGFRPNGPGVAAVRDTLQQCREAGWTAALVMMPESTLWRSWYDPEGLRQVDTVVARLAAEFRVPVFDGRAWIPDEQTIDGHHLTGPGADRFTDRLAREAIGPWLAAALRRTAP